MSTTIDQNGGSGDFTSDWAPFPRDCPVCRKPTVEVRGWESECGGYGDEQYRCTSCSHTWWVDGPDA